MEIDYVGNFSSIISSALLSLHEEAIDDIIASDIGEDITIYYPPRWIDCADCETDVIGNKPGTININGRPVPINAGNKCQFCGGTGKIQEETTEDIRGLIYWRLSSTTRWAKLFNIQIQIPDNFVELVADKNTLNKILSANFIEVATRHAPAKIYRYKLASEPEPLGFRGKYIICLLQKAG